MDDKIRVLIADDHALLREGIRALLSDEADIEVVGEAATGQQALRAAKELKPTVLMLDLISPLMDGLQALSQITHEAPEVRCLALSGSDARISLVEVIQRGAMGYLLKEASAPQMLDAIRTLAAGGAWLQPELAVKLFREVAGIARSQTSAAGPPLTPRESEIVRLVARGRSNCAIARELELSESTVKVHMSNVLRKLELRNRSQVTSYAIRNRLIDV